MPPKRTRRKNEEEELVAPAPKKKPKEPPKGRLPKAGAWKMPPPLPEGEILTEFTDRSKWRLGGSVGKGGFGEIYLASMFTASSKKAESPQYVIKVEPHDNGPLFSELSFYRRVAKPSLIEGWTKSCKLKYLPVPKFIGSGAHEVHSVKYRFMVMERFGDNLDKLRNEKFSLKTVCYVGLRMIEALEYIHDSEYVHADIKGTNILTGYLPADKHKVYLVDYGLAYRYVVDGVHHEYKTDPKRCHDGTIEFTSIDAHDGACPSRRGDMEILGYCLIQWAGGVLPWMGWLENKPKVATEKKKYKSNAVGLLRASFKDGVSPEYLHKYMESVYKLEYDETPDYATLKGIFNKTLDKNRLKDDKNGLDWLASTSTKPTKDKPVESVVDQSPPADDIPEKPGVRRSPRIAVSRAKRVFNSNEAQNEPIQKKKAKHGHKDTENAVKDIPPPPSFSKKKSPKKPKRTVASRNPVQNGDKGPVDVGPGKEDSCKAGNKVPNVLYPRSLGYIVIDDSEPEETFGSLAEKKRKKIK